MNFWLYTPAARGRLRSHCRGARRGRPHLRLAGAAALPRLARFAQNWRLGFAAPARCVTGIMQGRPFLLRRRRRQCAAAMDSTNTSILLVILFR